MFGYIYNVETREIATKVQNVKACNDTTIKGNGIAIIGTGQYIITDIEYEEGNILPNDVIDKRNQMPLFAE